MKKILIILIVALSSCATQRDLSGYDRSGWTVTKDSVVVARVTGIEFELSPRGKIIQEISLTVDNITNVSQANEILYYVSKQFPKSKIELNLDGIEMYKTNN